MPTHLALLRGINVGGHAMVPMAHLRALLESQGHTQVRTLLQSGNVVFTAKGPVKKLESTLESALQTQFARVISVIVRTAPEWHALVAANLYPDFAKTDPSHLVAMCFKSPPTPAQVAALRAAYTGPEQFTLHKATLYLTYPDGIGRSKLTNTLIERHLKSPGTARNWNTVLKLAALLPS